jgi:predicted HicB family RNase H-like nuclease
MRTDLGAFAYLHACADNGERPHRHIFIQLRTRIDDRAWIYHP